MDAWAHFQGSGSKEGRQWPGSPCPLSCSEAKAKYLADNADVKNTDPWAHYLSNGLKEGRKWPGEDCTPTDACSGQAAPPVTNACLNLVWKSAGCKTTIPAAYQGWWTKQPLETVRKDMALWGQYGKDPASDRYQLCSVASNDRMA